MMMVCGNGQGDDDAVTGDGSGGDSGDGDNEDDGNIIRTSPWLGASKKGNEPGADKVLSILLC